MDPLERLMAEGKVRMFFICDTCSLNEKCEGSVVGCNNHIEFKCKDRSTCKDITCRSNSNFDNSAKKELRSECRLSH